MYTDFYGLNEEPFRLTPDPKFLHLAEPHRNSLITLLRGIVYRKGFLVATGPVGTGKTTLLHACLHILVQRFANNRKLLSAFVINPTLTPQEFLEALLDEFEISCASTSKARRIAALHQTFADAQRQGSTAVIFIDEAHLLNDELLEEIRLLGNLDSYQGKLVQIVLAGQPELTSLLGQPRLAALQQRIAARCALRALSLAETQAYVAERLHAAGLRKSSPFSTAVLEQIYRFSGGVPRLINTVCDSCLVLGYETKRKPIALDMVVDVAVGLGLVTSIDGLPIPPTAALHGQAAIAAADGFAPRPLAGRE